MKEEILFSEFQRFRQPWLWVLILGIDCIFVYGFIQQVILGHVFGSKPMSNLGISIALLFSIVIPITFFSIRLETIIKCDGIYFRFFPFQRQFKMYAWKQLSDIYVRKYHPISEYGGWGYRIMLGSGRAYNVSGNMGIQLVLYDGSKLLIGTAKPEEAKTALEKINLEK